MCELHHSKNQQRKSCFFDRNRAFTNREFELSNSLEFVSVAPFPKTAATGLTE